MATSGPSVARVVSLDESRRSHRVPPWWYLPDMAKPHPTIRLRIVVAMAVGVIAGFFAYHQLTGRGHLASDFEYALRAARHLLAGVDPYNDPTVGFGLPYPFDAQFPYPIFAAMAAVPFTFFGSYIAGAMFVGAISGIMAYGITRDGWWRLSLFLSPCYFVAASVANWSPLLIASAFLPVVFAVAIAKPTLAAPIVLNYPSWLGYALSAAVAILSLVVMPTWPLAWLASVVGQQPDKYLVPVLMGPTALILIASVWWRDRAARLLLMFGCVPQHAFFYDQLVLWLVPQTLRQSLALSAVGWVAYLSWSLYDNTFDPWLAQTLGGPELTWTAPMFYLPALVLVMWQRFIASRRRPGSLVESVSADQA